MVFCAALNCLNYSKSKVSSFKFPANSKLGKQWLLKMKRKEFQPGKNSRICAVHFTEDYFRENLAIRRFLGSDFKSLRDGPLFFWRGGGGGNEKSLSANFFFLSMHLCKQFFFNKTFLQTIFFRSFLAMTSFYDIIG